MGTFKGGTHIGLGRITYMVLTVPPTLWVKRHRKTCKPFAFLIAQKFAYIIALQRQVRKQVLALRDTLIYTEILTA